VLPKPSWPVARKAGRDGNPDGLGRGRVTREWTADDFPPSRVPRRRFTGRPPKRSLDERLAEWKREAEAAKALRGFDADVRLALLDQGMRQWMAAARRKWLQNGGYGLATVEQARDIVAAGFALDPRTRPEVVAAVGSSADRMEADPSRRSRRSSRVPVGPPPAEAAAEAPPGAERPASRVDGRGQRGEPAASPAASVSSAPARAPEKSQSGRAARTPIGARGAPAAQPRASAKARVRRTRERPKG